MIECMKSRTEYLTLNPPTKMRFKNITPEVAEAVRKSGVKGLPSGPLANDSD